MNTDGSHCRFHDKLEQEPLCSLRGLLITNVIEKG